MGGRRPRDIIKIDQLWRNKTKKKKKTWTKNETLIFEIGSCFQIS